MIRADVEPNTVFARNQTWSWWPTYSEKPTMLEVWRDFGEFANIFKFIPD